MVTSGRPPQVLPQDAPELHDSPTVRDWLVPVVAQAFSEARAALADIEVPLGCRPLDPYAVVAMCREIRQRRYPAEDDQVSFTLALRPDGLYLGPIESIDAIGLTTGHVVDKSTLVTHRLVPLPRPRLTRMGLEHATEDDERALCIEDARALASWYVRDADSRTWRVGDAWPPPLPDFDAVAEGLSAPVVRAVMRCVHARLESFPSKMWPSCGPLIFDPIDGTSFGGLYPLGPRYIGRGVDTYLRIAAPVSDDPEVLALLEQQLHEVRVRGDGVVVIPS